MVRIYFELSVMVLFGQGLMFGFFDYGDVIGVDVVVLGIYFGKVNLKVRIRFKGVRNQEGGVLRKCRFFLDRFRVCFIVC